MGISAFSTLAGVTASTRMALNSVMPGLLWSSGAVGHTAAHAGGHAGSNQDAGNAYCKAIPSLRASHPLATNAARLRSRRLLNLVKAQPLNAPQVWNGASALDLAPTDSLPPHSPAVVSRLRVLREFEPGKHPAAAGRMVISGRMVDVCAELDRLAGAASAH